MLYSKEIDYYLRWGNTAALIAIFSSIWLLFIYLSKLPAGALFLISIIIVPHVIAYGVLRFRDGYPLKRSLIYRILFVIGFTNLDVLIITYCYLAVLYKKAIE